MTSKGPYNVAELKTLANGSQGWGKYLLLEKNQRKLKDGREVINLKIGDTSGEIDVICWDNCQISGNLENGTVIGVLGDIGAYNNRPQMTARRVKILDDDPAP